jgi:hypothetical protein
MAYVQRQKCESRWCYEEWSRSRRPATRSHPSRSYSRAVNISHGLVRSRSREGRYRPDPEELRSCLRNGRYGAITRISPRSQLGESALRPSSRWHLQARTFTSPRTSLQQETHRHTTQPIHCVAGHSRLRNRPKCYAPRRAPIYAVICTARVRMIWVSWASS